VITLIPPSLRYQTQYENEKKKWTKECLESVFATKKNGTDACLK